MKRHAILAGLMTIWLGMLAAPAVADEAVPPVVHHEATITFDVDRHEVMIEDRMVFSAPADSLSLNGGLSLTGISHSVSGNRMSVKDILGEEPGLVEDPGVIDRIAVPEDIQPLDGVYRLRLSYSGKFLQSTEDVSFSRENVGGEIEATIGEEGIYLSSSAYWLPAFEGTMATYRLTIDTPAGIEPVTQGVRVSQEVKDGRLITVWEAKHPSDGINLIANRYHISEDKVGDVAIYTYLLEEDQRLSDLYLERTRAYLAMYEEMLGPYPYGKFATVENWFPTGYGMPSYTLLGGMVMRLPFIPYTSFGHEICHNWWGNSVFVGEGGNWCEGLTSYCADYHYKQLESDDAAREYRRNLLKDYAAYVGDGAQDQDFPLTEFESRHSGATRAVGYGKSMMTFHMVARLIGREAFLTGLRRLYEQKRFQPATWSDFFAAFAAASGQDLGTFQEQWLTRTGAPLVHLEEAERKGDRVRVKLRQGPLAYDLHVPVLISTPDGEVEHVVHLTESSGTFTLTAPGATQVAVDPGCHLFRRLHPGEIEPTISQVLGENVPLFVLPAGSEEEIEAAHQFAVDFTEVEQPMTHEGGRPPEDVAPGAAVGSVLINPQPDVLKSQLPDAMTLAGYLVFLEGRRYSLKDYDLVLAAANPHDPTVTDLIVLSRSPQRIPSLARRVGHYGKYSWLLFPAARGQTIKGNWQPAGSPLVAKLGQ